MSSLKAYQIFLLLFGLALLPTHAVAQAFVFTHGVASGDPDASSVVLWARFVTEGQDAAVTWEVSEDSSFTAIVAYGTALARQQHDFCVKVIAGGLQPGQTYYYRFVHGAQVSQTGRTRTLPANPERVKIGVANCAKYTGGYYHAYDALAEMDDLDVVIHLGDYIYENGPSIPESSYWPAYVATGRQHDPPRHALTLDEYRTRYAQYRSDPDLQKLHATHPMINIWDDHEIAAEPRTELPDGRLLSPAAWEARKNHSIQAYHEWLPIRVDAFDPIYRAFQFGDLVNLMMLDTRVCCRSEVFKTEASLQDTSRHIIGHTQMNWMFSEIETTAATWNVIGNQILIARKGKGWNRWQGFPADRNRLLNYMQAADSLNFLVTTGNAHNPHHYVVLDAARRDTIVHEVLPGAISSGNNAEKARYDSLILAKEDLRLRQEDNVRWYNQDAHGFIVLDLTRASAKVDWYFVSSIRREGYTMWNAHSIEVPAK